MLKPLRKIQQNKNSKTKKLEIITGSMEGQRTAWLTCADFWVMIMVSHRGVTLEAHGGAIWAESGMMSGYSVGR